tara:strand:- start:340 stop:1149 length:810 start_codon:yes stop_codon:yes gene_type:complete
MKTTPKYPNISAAIRLGLAALLVIGGLSTANLRADDKKPTFKKASEDLITKIRAMIGKDRDGAIKEYTKGTRKLAKDYPEEIGPRAMLLEASSLVSDAKEKKAILADIAALKNPKFAPIVERAKGELKKVEALGKPVNIKFKAVDGREIDTAKMKGKVVLIDFWATWCGPCVAEIPNVKKSYEKLHKKGFEIIGISLDSSEQKLNDFVSKNAMSWPQYFDGKGWSNKLAKEYGISSIPAMWLVDKKGNLVDMNARNNLDSKIEKLLSEE